MLIGNRAAFIGVIFGIFLAILLISQQSAIFLGLVTRSYRMVTDFSQPNIWVMDPSTRGEDLIRAMPREYLTYIKRIPNIEWAVPLRYLQLPLSTASGIFRVTEIYGIDDETLMGAPVLIEGNLRDLHQEGGIIIDSSSVSGMLAKVAPNGQKIPLEIGDRLEINGVKAIIVGIAKVTPGFYPQPVVYTMNNQFQRFSGSNRIEYIAAKTQDKADVDQVLKQINNYPNVLGMTSDQLARRIAKHFLGTGILINFGLSVILGLIIGFSIAGQIFYIMTIHNLMYYALIKALGGSQKMILSMIIVQALMVGMIGYFIGTGVTLLWGFAVKDTSLTFDFPWQLLVFTGSLALLICIFTVCLSAKKVLKLDPKILMNL